MRITPGKKPSRLLVWPSPNTGRASSLSLPTITPAVLAIFSRVFFLPPSPSASPVQETAISTRKNGGRVANPSNCSAGKCSVWLFQCGNCEAKTRVSPVKLPLLQSSVPITREWTKTAQFRAKILVFPFTSHEYYTIFKILSRSGRPALLRRLRKLHRNVEVCLCGVKKMGNHRPLQRFPQVLEVPQLLCLLPAAQRMLHPASLSLLKPRPALARV